MKNIGIISDSELGEVVFRKNNLAKNYIIRISRGNVRVTVPFWGNYTKAKDFLYANRQKALSTIRQQAVQSEKHFPEVDELELRRKAQLYLPLQLSRLSRLHGFTHTGPTIRKSNTRWGSCSAKKAISLSLYLMLLPEHLIEYVLLHELCHTVHMNHSPAFWALLDKCTNNKAKLLRAELREPNKLSKNNSLYGNRL